MRHLMAQDGKLVQLHLRLVLAVDLLVGNQAGSLEQSLIRSSLKTAILDPQ